jgi:hypothetical protein
MIARVPAAPVAVTDVDDSLGDLGQALRRIQPSDALLRNEECPPVASRTSTWCSKVPSSRISFVTIPSSDVYAASI